MQGMNALIMKHDGEPLRIQTQSHLAGCDLMMRMSGNHEKSCRKVCGWEQTECEISKASQHRQVGRGPPVASATHSCDGVNGMWKELAVFFKKLLDLHLS